MAQKKSKSPAIITIIKAREKKIAVAIVFKHKKTSIGKKKIIRLSVSYTVADKKQITHFISAWKMHISH